MRKMTVLFVVSFFICLPVLAKGKTTTWEGPNLGPMATRIKQDQITRETLSFKKIQQAGKVIFTTPFNKHDGYGDGIFDPEGESPRDFGNRPTLQGNGTFLRVNGLDAQTCLECHFILKNSTIPAKFGIGGVAGANANAVFMPTLIDVAEENPGEINGRFINPPFLFGSGGVELLAKEMTADLQKLKEEARDNPGTSIELTTKGIRFGRIYYDNEGIIDTTGVEGIDDDLVVRPFGRKGEFATVRGFDVLAMQFHFGMQTVEDVGEDVDADGDRVFNEILVGEISALHIFNTTLDRPIIEKHGNAEKEGFQIFKQIGCALCHRPVLHTKSRVLTYSFPEIETDPGANVFYWVDLTKRTNFRRNRQGGIIVPLFSDLKRHDLGSAMAESFDIPDEPTNREFITARLWGIRDTAPYMHDGRAQTITEAVRMHGEEAEPVRTNFDNLNDDDEDRVLAFLYSLCAPKLSER
ncbi:MAG: hypothetical protein LJE96_09730 [Deltaproteobacteria bacterium]|nr:hypothetical protein [Deltaproteobacteria bacterium]